KTADNDGLTLHLVKNPDVLATISTTYPHLLTVGFAAETNDVESYAKGKLISKNLDMIACNDVSDKTIGFGSDDNAMTVFFAEKYGKDKVDLAKMSKDKIAKNLVDCVARLLNGG
ncbi:MAG: phosphopantothenoylcysteine decarboxylase, partial [Moraxella sp.]|nr:phosphopantothenoylcysteine decarboxylase [Moraxella sp.]